MLVLTRSVDDIVRIGDDITVRVLSIHGNSVRLGFEAPTDIPVFRQEVLDRSRDKPIGDGGAL